MAGDDPVEAAFLLRYQQKWTIPAIATSLAVSQKTINRWIKLYGNKQSRYWAGTRFKRTRTKTYGQETSDRVKTLKGEVPTRSAVAIHALLQQDKGNQCPSIETIRPILRGLGMSRGKSRDRKGYVKFERECPNDLWQVDFKGEDRFGSLGKLSLLAILDDCSRFVLAARWCPRQDESHVILLLREAFEKHGLPNEIISDNGLQFKSLHGGPATRYARLLGILGVRVLYHAPGHPQTKGKLERWFGTVMSSFMPEAQHLVATRPGLTLDQLNQKFAEWLEWYNSRHPHTSLGRQPPARVYQEHPRRIFHPLDVVVNWDAWVEILEERKVFKNNRISINGKSYTLPPGFVGTRVQVRMLEDRYEITSAGASVETFYKSPGDVKTGNFVERVIAKNGTFKFKRKTYYVGYKLACTSVKVQVAATGKEILVYTGDTLLARLSISDGSAY